jgi:hypothetical protein
MNGVSPPIFSTGVLYRVDLADRFHGASTGWPDFRNLPLLVPSQLLAFNCVFGLAPAWSWPWRISVLRM